MRTEFPRRGLRAIYGVAAAILLASLAIGAPVSGRAHYAIAIIAFLVALWGVVYIVLRTARSPVHVHASAGIAEQRLRDAADMAEDLNLLIESAHGQAIFMLDAAGHVTIWNKGAERLTGWTDADAVGAHVVLFYPPEAVAEGNAHDDLARAAAEGRIEKEGWRIRKDGSRFLAAVAVTALRDAGGKIRGYAKIVSDITERRAAEDAARNSENHLRSILSTIPDAMIVIDEAGAIQSFSAAAGDMFGYSQRDVLGQNVSILIPQPERDQHDGYIKRYLETGEKRIIGVGRLVSAMRKDGTIFPAELSIGEAYAGTHRIFTGFIRDLTERRRDEERFAALQAELIHVSRVSAMGAMASTLAHELNQPITAVCNYVEAVRDLLVEPDAVDMPMIRGALDDAAKEALRAGEIIRHLRDFVARGEVRKTVESLPDLVREASGFGLLGTDTNALSVDFDLDPNIPDVLVDKIQIEQVLINLIRNALDAMRESAVKQLMIAARPDQPGYIRVSISDTGVGVSPDMMNQLFSAFVSTKREGMGLGLSICRTIVEANGGRIWMEPRTGGGTEFHFTLVSAGTEKQDAQDTSR